MSEVARSARSAWATPVLIAFVALGAFGAGWLSGRSGSFVSGLLRAAETKAEIERNLDQALRTLGGTSDNAARLLKEKLNLESRVRGLERKARTSPPPAPDARDRKHTWSRGACS